MTSVGISIKLSPIYQFETIDTQYTNKRNNLMMKKISSILFSYKSTLILTIVFTMIGCNGLFYHPSDIQFDQEEILKLEPEQMEFQSQSGNKLHGWYFKTSQAKRKGLIVQFHGNAQNMSTHFSFLYWVTLQGYDLFVFDYSGYGKSEGTPTPENLRNDAIAAMQLVENKLTNDKTPVILFAQSLGVAVLTDAFPLIKNRKQIKAVILDSGFYSYQEIARDVMDQFWLFWPFQHLAYLLVSDSHSPEKQFREFSPIPTLVIHGKHDGVIPFHHSEKIMELLKSPKIFWKIEDGTHTSAMQGHGGLYRMKLMEYLDGL